VIRSAAHFCCFLLGILLCVADGFHWYWPTVIILVAIPWDKVYERSRPTLEAWAAWWEERRIQKMAQKVFRLT
jgi:hypothetical protein